MSEKMTAQAKFASGMRFIVTTSSGHQVAVDTAEEHGGLDSAARPMELLLAGLAGCTGMDVISILKKKRQQVTDYEIIVRGVRAEEHPMVFVEINVEHIVTGYHIQPEAVARAIQLSEERYCGAGAMLGKVAHLTHTFQVIDTAQPLEITPVRPLALTASHS